MITFFSPAELASAEIIFTGPAKSSPRYITERDEIWEQKLAKAEKENRKLWNGTIYTIEKLLQIDEENLKIVLSFCEFKDIVFRISKGIPYMQSAFGIDHIPKFITVDCIPISSDGKFVFGLRGNKTNVADGSIGLLGGTVNKDEMEISTFNDFTTFMIREIQEETHIKVEKERLNLFSLNQFRGKYEFLYTLDLEIESSKINTILKDDEFSEMLCLSREEVFAWNRPTVDAFRYCRNYIDKIKRR